MSLAKDKFYKLVSSMAKMTNTGFDDFILEMYDEGLHQYGYDRINATLTEMFRNLKRFPTIQDIEIAMGETPLEISDEDEARQLTEKLFQKAASIGCYARWAEIQRGLGEPLSEMIDHAYYLAVANSDIGDHATLKAQTREMFKGRLALMRKNFTPDDIPMLRSMSQNEIRDLSKQRGIEAQEAREQAEKALQIEAENKQKHLENRLQIESAEDKSKMDQLKKEKEQTFKIATNYWCIKCGTNPKITVIDKDSFRWDCYKVSACPNHENKGDHGNKLSDRSNPPDWVSATQPNVKVNLMTDFLAELKREKADRDNGLRNKGTTEKELGN